MAKLVRHLTSNEEIVSSNLAEGNVTYFFIMVYLMRCQFIHQMISIDRGARARRLCCRKKASLNLTRPVASMSVAEYISTRNFPPGKSQNGSRQGTQPESTRIADLSLCSTMSSGEKVPQDSILDSFEKIKTHFPAARIKKIMQSDEDIGKVAQATPVVVGRALEIFMANLVEAAVSEAKKNGVRRIGASHVRAAVENTDQFDFLVDAMEKYPALKQEGK
jgi:hypothetical protein